MARDEYFGMQTYPFGCVSEGKLFTEKSDVGKWKMGVEREMGVIFLVFCFVK